MALIGYARVSTDDQDHALQLDALTGAGCERVFSDTASGKLDERPGLAQALDYLRDGDTLVVWRLDRLGRSIHHLLATVAALGERGVQFRSTTEGLDTSTPAGEFVFHIFAALAQFERSLIVERTQAGLTAAAARGRKGGRPPKMTPERIAAAKAMIAGGQTATEVARILGVGRTTLYAHLGD
ncbi:recombinase family protein [Polymorphospora rubra]|uniref:recombinase family protein n=1 Tax=Polymorphospora rubra TaxID=338584 RepID=UPI0033F03566